MSAIALTAVVAWPVVVAAQGQTPMASSAADLSAPYFLPIGPPAALAPSKPADLSGDWVISRDALAHSLSSADRMGEMRGKEADIRYKPWALAKTLSEVPATGPDSKFEQTTDPSIHYCEPLGLGRIYMYPAKTKFIQTPEAVYIMHELGPAFRIVWLNARHPEDPDPQYWGHSIGWYENGDTLVVDTVGVNDRSWLDQLGHPHSERMHFIERYTRADGNTISIDLTVDDPGAYTAPWGGKRALSRSTTGFLRYQWVCSVRDNYAHYDKVGKTGNPGATSFAK
jgi:hypothetical protein